MAPPSFPVIWPFLPSRPEAKAAQNYQQTGDWKKFKQLSTTINDPGGIHDLYFVFKKDTEPNHDLFALDWLRFEK